MIIVTHATSLSLIVLKPVIDRTLLCAPAACLGNAGNYFWLQNVEQLNVKCGFPPIPPADATTSVGTGTKLLLHCKILKFVAPNNFLLLFLSSQRRGDVTLHIAHTHSIATVQPDLWHMAAYAWLCENLSLSEATYK